VGRTRIHGELLKLGIEVGQSTVAKYMVKRPGQPGQSWTIFLRNEAMGIAARTCSWCRRSASDYSSVSSFWCTADGSSFTTP
jgi:hypothetical protein